VLRCSVILLPLCLCGSWCSNSILGSRQAVYVVECNARENEAGRHTNTMNHTASKECKEQASDDLGKQLRLKVSSKVHVLKVIDGGESEDKEL